MHNLGSTPHVAQSKDRRKKSLTEGRKPAKNLVLLVIWIYEGIFKHERPCLTTFLNTDEKVESWKYDEIRAA